MDSTSDNMNNLLIASVLAGLLLACTEKPRMGECYMDENTGKYGDPVENQDVYEVCGVGSSGVTLRNWRYRNLGIEFCMHTHSYSWMSDFYVRVACPETKCGEEK